MKKMKLNPSEEENLEQLVQQANASLESADYARAEMLGKKLLALEAPQGYHVLATAYAGAGEKEKAVAILESALQKYPDNWQFWMRLGNYQSDAGMADKAMASFEKGLACPDSYQQLIQLNMVILMARQNQNEEALELCESINDEVLYGMATRVRFELLNQMERYYDVLSHDLEKLEVLSEEGIQVDWAEIYMQQAFAQWNFNENIYQTKEFLREVFRLNRKHARALWLLREINSESSHYANYYRVKVQGCLLYPREGESSPPSFITVYEVVAENPKEALEFIRDMESEDVDKYSLKIYDTQQVDNPNGNPKGIYKTSRMIFYH